MVSDVHGMIGAHVATIAQRVQIVLAGKVARAAGDAPRGIIVRPVTGVLLVVHAQVAGHVPKVGIQTVWKDVQVEADVHKGYTAHESVPPYPRQIGLYQHLYIFYLLCYLLFLCFYGDALY